MVRRKQARPASRLIAKEESDGAPFVDASDRKSSKKARRSLPDRILVPSTLDGEAVLSVGLALPPMLVDSTSDDHTAVRGVCLAQGASDGIAIGHLTDDVVVKWSPLPWDLTPAILTALAHLTFNHCVALEMRSQELVVHVRMVSRPHMRLLMAWLLLASHEQWTYPYPEELDAMVTPSPSTAAAYNPSQLLAYTTARPFSAAGDAFVPCALLLPELRRYQRAAVAWMLEREAAKDASASVLLKRAATTVATLRRSGQTYDPFSASFGSATAVVAPVRGGILADEMGLGKTVQVLACILAHPCPWPTTTLQTTVRAIAGLRSCVCNSSDDHTDGWTQCGGCGVLQHRLCTGATGAAFHCDLCLRSLAPAWAAKSTLIVSPQSIHLQWEQEVLRHTRPGAVSIFNYDGIKAMRQRLPGPSADWQFCRADALATFDIVLTTYETLRDDVYHVADTGPALRRASRYRRVASPLTHVAWWRVCLDEAQLVESPQALAAVTAGRLSAQHRWWVTGTPFGKRADDVLAPLTFLRALPEEARSGWRRLVATEVVSSRARDVLRALLWRNRKADVEAQIALPPQTTRVEWLELSAIEAHFYEEQLAACAKAYPGGDEVTPAMAQSLVRLRQACCHPQVGEHGIRALESSGRAMSMDAILGDMLADACASEAQRRWVAAANALAGILTLEGDTGAAVGIYVDAIALMRHNWDEFRADVLPRLHAVVGCSQLLEQFVPERVALALPGPPLDAKQAHGLPSLAALEPFLGDAAATHLRAAPSVVRVAIAALQEAAIGLEGSYLRATSAQHDAALCKYQTATEAARAVDDTVALLAPLAAITPGEFDRRRACWLGRSPGFARFARQFGTVAGLVIVAQQTLTTFLAQRMTLHAALLRLSEAPTSADIARSGNCKACRQDRAGARCQHCELSPLLTELGAAVDDDGSVAVLLQIADANTLAAVRKALTRASKLWQAQHARLGALDELAMAKTRMQLVVAPTTVSDTVAAGADATAAYTLQAHELPLKRQQFQADRADAGVLLRDARHKLRYLQQLRRLRGVGDEDCTVCHEPMVAQRAVWACAHVLCRSCTMLLLGRAGGGRCPVCRGYSAAAAIRFVRDETSLGALFVVPTTKIPAVVGGSGSKMDRIVACIRSLGAAKVLVFSQWQDVLRILATALGDAGVRFLHPETKRAFAPALSAFKAATGGCVLALSFRQGANGLNLVEATHVVLVEPLLSADDERQAVSRVHRLGQERPTTVHRFLVHNSVEEGVLMLQRSDRPAETLSAADWRLLLLQEPAAQHEVFWATEVLCRGRHQSRDGARRTLEVARSHAVLGAGGRITDEPVVVVCGARINLHVAHELLTDCPPSAATDADTALLQTLRHRIHVKLRVAGLPDPAALGG
ncbi:hypothetical protein ACHHYP_00833 [Achlya hypogyna]|uniref:RING-type domain-containing protein n=1 Tax=Achlya hypogyna TaxID=1202772 RepID=A0A1V9ZA83_ACHHY|nr:hypothetical protein ACHHYP_00833 [Achlya hypogyna]